MKDPQLATREEIDACLALHEANETAERWKREARANLWLAILGALVAVVEAATIVLLVRG